MTHRGAARRRARALIAVLGGGLVLLLAAGGVDFAAYASVPYVIDGDIAAGIPVTAVNGPFLSEHIARALDRSSPLNGGTLLARLNGVVAAMHADGSLRALSIRWFGVDLTEPPAG